MSSFEDSLFEAAKKGYEDDMIELLKSKVDLNIVDYLKNTPLHYAAGTGHARCVELLVQTGRAKLDLLNNIGETPLHKAAAGSSQKHSDCCRVLVNGGARLDIRNNDGNTPFQICLNSAKDILVPADDVAGFDPDAIAEDSEESSD